MNSSQPMSLTETASPPFWRAEERQPPCPVSPADPRLAGGTPVRTTTRKLRHGHREPLLLENQGGMDKIGRYVSAGEPHGFHRARPPILDLGFLCRAARLDVQERSGDSHIGDFCPRRAEIAKGVPVRQWPPLSQSGSRRQLSAHNQNSTASEANSGTKTEVSHGWGPYSGGCCGLMNHPQ